MPSVFVPGKLVNPLNGAHGHWAKAAAYRKRWRQAVRMMLNPHGWAFRAQPTDPPRPITLTASTWNTMDADGLAASLKPVVDGLVDARLILSDAPDSGHQIIYAQQIDRRQRGVEIRWEVLPPSAPTRS